MLACLATKNTKMRKFLASIIIALSGIALGQPLWAQSRCSQIFATHALFSDLNFRLADKSDIYGLVSFIRQTREGLGVNPFATADHRPAFSDFLEFEKNFQSPNGKLILLQNAKGEIKGTVAYTKIDSNTCELKKFYLAQEIQGQGSGSNLLQLIIQEATKAGFQKMLLQTDSTMKAAIHLYEKFGFHLLTNSRTGDQALYYEKDL